MAENTSTHTEGSPAFPRVTIEYCTKCKWMLRAAYFAQELLSTFSTSLGEVAIQPSTSGTFRVSLATQSSASSPQHHLLWDRKAEGGFPETKELKRRVRNIIEPDRDLGHVDRDYNSSTETKFAAVSALDDGQEGNKGRGQAAAAAMFLDGTNVTVVPSADNEVKEGDGAKVCETKGDGKCEDCE